MWTLTATHSLWTPKWKNGLQNKVNSLPQIHELAGQPSAQPSPAQQHSPSEKTPHYPDSDSEAGTRIPQPLDVPQPNLQLAIKKYITEPKDPIITTSREPPILSSSSGN